MTKSFTSFAELQAEIALLKVQKLEQEEQIHEKFKNRSAVFSTVISLFKKSPGSPSFIEELIGGDLVTAISRVLVPVFMNSFIFRKSNFITKAIVAMISQKAAKNVDTGLLNNVIDKVKGLFEKFSKKKDTRQSPASAGQAKDYGIPPFSETA